MPKSHDYHGDIEVARRKEMGRRIDAAREKLGLNKGEMAARIGVSAATYTGWIKGTHGPTVQNLRRIVAVTGEPSSYFNPESLAKRDSIEWLSRALGARLGHARIERLLDLPASRLKKEIDAIIGQFIVEQTPKKHRGN